MKKVFTFLSLIGALCVGNSSNAQSFSVHHDTSYVNTSGSVSVENNITVPGSATVPIQWRISYSNLPDTMMKTVGICDNVTCFGSADIWPAVVKLSSYPTGTGDFHITLDFSSPGIPVGGPYVMKVKLNNQTNTNDTAIQTYIVSKIPAAIQPVKINTDVTLYPNPATSALNVVYDASADVKNIAIYNIIGKQMSLFRVTDNTSASLNLENIPSGIYFVRLVNSHGDVVTTRKFTKQ